MPISVWLYLASSNYQHVIYENRGSQQNGKVGIEGKVLRKYLPGDESNGGSLSTPVYSNTRSKEVILFSSSADCRIPHWIIPISPIHWVMARPTSPPYGPASIFGHSKSIVEKARMSDDVHNSHGDPF